MIGFVTGLTAEATLARRLSPLVCAGGGTPQGAAKAALSLLDQGARALVSFGLAGGLDPALLPGALVVPARVMTNDDEFICDPELSAQFGGFTIDLHYAGEKIVITAAQKAALFVSTGAAAIDLESGAVAKVAAQAGVAFAVLRAVCDPAGRDLPNAAMIALDPQGAISGVRVLMSVLRSPGQIFGLTKLAWDARAARARLVALRA